MTCTNEWKTEETVSIFYTFSVSRAVIHSKAKFHAFNSVELNKIRIMFWSGWTTKSPCQKSLIRFIWWAFLKNYNWFTKNVIQRFREIELKMMVKRCFQTIRVNNNIKLTYLFRLTEYCPVWYLWNRKKTHWKPNELLFVRRLNELHI